ncbi:MAG: RecX family transcriptional regulator [Pseudomonadales bacterium]|nr:RecX family transcriptional regulator [Pseudomonadales bacterium]
MPEIKPSDIRRAAMDLLARREHSYQELMVKLTRRFRKVLLARASREIPTSCKIETETQLDVRAEIDTNLNDAEKNDAEKNDAESNSEIDIEHLIEIEITKLRDENLQSDYRLAEAYIRSRSNRGQGPIKIKAELRAKGLVDRMIIDAFDMAAIDWPLLAQVVRDKKFGDAETRCKQQDELSAVECALEHNFENGFENSFEDSFENSSEDGPNKGRQKKVSQWRRNISATLKKSSMQQQAKQNRFLQQRGFTFEQIQQTK